MQALKAICPGHMGTTLAFSAGVPWPEDFLIRH